MCRWILMCFQRRSSLIMLPSSHQTICSGMTLLDPLIRTYCSSGTAIAIFSAFQNSSYGTPNEEWKSFHNLFNFFCNLQHNLPWSAGAHQVRNHYREIISALHDKTFIIWPSRARRLKFSHWTEDRAEFLKLKLDEVLKTSVLLHDALWALGESKKIITIQALKANGLCNYEENAIASIRILDRESREMIEDKKWRISSEWSRWMSNRPEKRAGCYQWAITYRR